MAKYYFYYNADDGTIEEVTRQAGIDGAYTFDSSSGSANEGDVERHFTDGSTFMPLCFEWGKNHSENPGITGNIDSFHDAFTFNDTNRFGMHPGVWLGGSFTILGQSEVPFQNGETLLRAWEADDWDGTSGNPCLDSSPEEMTVNWGLVYSPDDTGFDTIYNNSTTDIQYIDSVEGNGINTSDGLNNDGNSTSGGSLRARGADAKIRLLLADNQVLETGYYAVEIGSDDNDVMTATTAQGNTFNSHINESMIKAASANTFWGVPKRWVVSPSHLSSLGLQTQSSFDIIDSVSSGSSNIQANGDITWTVTLDSVYYNTTPLHGITNEATRELGYIIWKNDGTTISIVGDTTSTSSLQRKVTLTRAGSGSAQNGTVNSSRQFTVTLPSSEVLNNHQYYIQFFETPDTYRFTKTNTNASSLSNVNQWDGWYDTYNDILTHIVNGASPTLSINNIETTFPHSVVNRSQTTADNDLTGFMAGVTEIPMCDDTVKYAFQVGNGTGEIISEAQSISGNSVKGLFGPTGTANAKFNTDELYCEVNWTDTIYAKNVIGVSSQWTSQVQARNASIGTPRTGIKISGSAKSQKGSLFAFEGTTPLDDGWYIVCTPAKTATNVLTNPVPNSNLQITSTSTGVGTLTVNVNTVLAANNSSAGNTNGCWDGKTFNVRLSQSPGGNLVAREFETVGQTGWQNITFSGLSSGTYTVQLRSGHSSSTLASQMHVGVSLDAELDESTGISVTAPPTDPELTDVTVNNCEVTLEFTNGTPSTSFAWLFNGLSGGSTASTNPHASFDASGNATVVITAPSADTWTLQLLDLATTNNVGFTVNSSLPNPSSSIVSTYDIEVENVCANNPLYYFQVVNGRIDSGLFNICNDSSNNNVKLTDGHYCNTPLTVHRKANGDAWSETETNDLCVSCETETFTAKIKGYYNQADQGTTDQGAFIYDADLHTNPAFPNQYLSDGYYMVCGSLDASQNPTLTLPAPTHADSSVCDEKLYYFQVLNGNIVPAVMVNNPNNDSGYTSGDLAHGFLRCGGLGDSNFHNNVGIYFKGAERNCGSSQNSSCAEDTYCSASITVFKSSLGPWQDPPNACANCTDSIPDLTQINAFVKGRSKSGYEINIFTDPNDKANTELEDGWYVYCGTEQTGENITVTAQQPLCYAHWILIEEDGKWNGAIRVCDALDGSSILEDQVGADDFFDEATFIQNNAPASWLTKSDGSPWASSAGSVDDHPCDIMCNDDVQSVQNVAVDGVVYISGGLVGTEDELLRVYANPGEQNPLAAGWYLAGGSCDRVFLPQPNGIRTARPIFDCYGNPFIWYSLKGDKTTVVDDNDYLTNGASPWFNDAPLKDLTTTGCDLAVANWFSVGETKGPTEPLMLQRRGYTSATTTWSQDASVNCSATGNIIDFNTSSSFLTRSGNSWIADPTTGQKIISSPKASATEMTIAVVVDCETNGTIFKITDASTLEGYGDYDKLKELSAVISSIELKKVSGSYELTTTRNNFSTTSSNSIQIVSGGGYEIIVMTLTSDGHSIRVLGGVNAESDSVPSNFCSSSGGITNLNVEIGQDKDITNTAIDMNFAEMIIYDEELNAYEIQELEGYLSHKWCLELSNNHLYHKTVPDCGQCQDDDCESLLYVSSNDTTQGFEVQCNYESSDSVYGYQFKLNLSGVTLPEGFYSDGDTINIDGVDHTLEFTDPLGKEFLNYIKVTQSGIWVFGHFNKHSEPSGGFDYVLPPYDMPSASVGDPLGQHFLTIKLNQQTTFDWSGASTSIIFSTSEINHPKSPNHIFATYDADGESAPVSQFTGDVDNNGLVSSTDVLEIVKRISKSHDNGPYDLDGDSWLETIDSIGKGWVDICDAVTCLINIIIIDGTHVGGNEIKPSNYTALSHPVCSEKLQPTKCLPCPCPEEPEDDDCVQKVWISDIQPTDSTGQFGIVTVKYQSSCCIDGYKLILGGLNDKVVTDGGGFHDGAVMVPSNGNTIGQITDQSETHLNGWLHGLTLSPSYKGEVALTNVNEIVTINSNLAGDLSSIANREIENKLLFPIVWGFSLGQNPALPTTAAGKVEREQALEDGRLGINCIPATCKGESKVLTKFVINLRSFLNPHISEFRLVTNDKAVAPASFASTITWTGDGDGTFRPSDGNTGGADVGSCLLYMYAGWGGSTNWDVAALGAAMPSAIDNFDAENDGNYLDIVDSLSLINHNLMFGIDATSDSQALIVPTDCCPCDVPANFQVTIDAESCCPEVEGQEGVVTVTWTESTNADGYIVYRILEEYSESSSSYNPLDPFNFNITGSLGLVTKGQILQTSFDNSLGVFFNSSNQNALTVSDEQAVNLYKEKIFNKKNALDYDKWKRVHSGGPDVTTFIDRNPPKFENCCPDDVLPSVKYVVVAYNDCGEKNTSAIHYPECCGTQPEAKDVDVGTLTVNSLTPLYADAFQHNALSPYGNNGGNIAATAEIVVNSVPTTNDTVIKLVKFDGTIVSFTVPQSATPRDVAIDLVAALNTDANFNAVVAADPSPSFTVAQLRSGECGNTEISVSGGDVDSVTVQFFSNGASQCTPGVDCENLAFFITSIVYSGPHAGDGLFVGPSGGGVLPSGNLTGTWSWKPPTGYVGDVTFHYVVINESGCSDEAEITVNYEPKKLILDCETPPCDSDDYGKVYIKLELPKTSNLSKFTVLRAEVATASTAVSWDVNTHAVTDENGNRLTFNMSDYPDNVFTFIDKNVPLPDECCTEDKIYKYIVYYCESGSLGIGTSTASVVNHTATFTGWSCTYSTECTVTIECCAPPKNVIPTGSVANCVEDKYGNVTIEWGAPTDGGGIALDNLYLYVVMRKKASDAEWTRIEEIDASPAGKNADNPYWFAVDNYSFTDSVRVSNLCDDSVDYHYAIVVVDNNKNFSGDPSDGTWGDGTAGDPCSPGGVTVEATIASCPPSICAEDMNVRICLDEDFEYDLSRFVGCIPRTVSGSEVSVTYTLTNQSADPDFEASITGSTLTFNTRGLSGETTHNNAIVIEAATSAPCASSDTINVNITLVDCGCPCPDDEADYTICDNNYDNEEYATNDTTTNELVRKLGNTESTEQIPFSLTNEGGQTLRKGQPYIVSKGKIDCD